MKAERRDPPPLRLPEERVSLENPRVSIGDPRATEIFGYQQSSAGVVVTEDRAMRLAAVYACVRVLAETVASLPLQVYRRTDAGKELAPSHPYQALLHDSPNESLTSFIWREVGTAHAALWGNHYSRLDWSVGGRLLGIYPLLPWRTEPIRRKGRLLYSTMLQDGSVEELPAEDVLHVPALGYDGVKGLSVIRHAALNSVGLAISAEDFGARFFENDARPGVVLAHPATLGDKALEHLKQSVSEKFGGKNRGRPMVLEEGMTLTEVGVPPEDAQFLETRKFQRSEIAGLYRVPPHMIGDLEKATFSNIEHQDIAFAKHTIRPWLVRWEQEMNRKIFGRSGAFCEFNLDGLLRGDFKSRMEGYQIGVGGPFLTPNEVRRLENMSPLAGGDRRLVPVNMTPVGDDGLPMPMANKAPEPAPQQQEPADVQA